MTTIPSCIDGGSMLWGRGVKCQSPCMRCLSEEEGKGRNEKNGKRRKVGRRKECGREAGGQGVSMRGEVHIAFILTRKEIM